MALFEAVAKPVARFLVPATGNCADQSPFRRQERGKLDRPHFGLRPICRLTPFEPDVLFYCSKESSVRGDSDVDHRVDNSWPHLRIASKVVNRTGEGFFLDIVLGIVGAIVGGFIFTAVGATGVTGFNLYSMFVAVVGAIVVLVLYHALFVRRAY